MKTKSNRKIFYVTWTCTLIVIALSAWTMFRSHRPSQGKPYERLTVEEAQLYMSYEAEYVIVDVRDPEAYDAGHLDGAVSIPFGQIVARADDTIGDRGIVVYVYGADLDQSCAAAQKLTDIGYSSVSEIGTYGDWMNYILETETEGLLTGELD